MVYAHKFYGLAKCVNYSHKSNTFANLKHNWPFVSKLFWTFLYGIKYLNIRFQMFYIDDVQNVFLRFPQIFILYYASPPHWIMSPCRLWVQKFWYCRTVLNYIVLLRKVHKKREKNYFFPYTYVRPSEKEHFSL